MRPTYRVLYWEKGKRQIVDHEFTILRDAQLAVVAYRKKGIESRYEQLRYGRAPR